MTIQATLYLIVKDDKVLLMKKSDGLFGQGKWNAPGGKILAGEEPNHSDQYWYRRALEGRKFEAWFYYSGDFEKFVDHKVEDSPLAEVET